LSPIVLDSQTERFDTARLKKPVVAAFLGFRSGYPEAGHAEHVRAKDFLACDQLGRVFSAPRGGICRFRRSCIPGNNRSPNLAVIAVMA
jgi:hypothetical protein